MFTAFLTPTVIRALIKNAPDIVVAARELAAYMGNKISEHEQESSAENSDDPNLVREQMESLGQRVDELELDESRQAELISEMAVHQQEISLGLRLLSNRVSLLIWLVSAALVAALVALIIGLISIST
tara:strand:- start:245 stop:628 length:384 start_codon:yes stop_codon:yes gene_type:complete